MCNIVYTPVNMYLIAYICVCVSGEEQRIYNGKGGGGINTFLEEKWWHLGTHTVRHPVSSKKMGYAPVSAEITRDARWGKRHPLNPTLCVCLYKWSIRYWWVLSVPTYPYNQKLKVRKADTIENEFCTKIITYFVHICLSAPMYLWQNGGCCVGVGVWGVFVWLWGVCDICVWTSMQFSISLRLRQKDRKRKANIF